MRIPGFLQPIFSFIHRLAIEYREDRTSLIAAAMSFYMFLSIVPLMLIAVAAVGYVLGSPEKAYHLVIDNLNAYSPQLAEKSGRGILLIITDIIRGRNTATGLGLISLLWAGSSAFANLETAINIAWDKRSRSYFKSRGIALLLLLMVGILFMVSFGITTVANSIRNHNYMFYGFNVSATFGAAWEFVVLLFPIALSIGTFTLMYSVLPNTKVPIRSALIGATVSGILWEIAKHAFSWYVLNFANYNAVYGSLAAVILLLVWIYYTSIITIIGAQISALISK